MVVVDVFIISDLEAAALCMTGLLSDEEVIGKEFCGGLSGVYLPSWESMPVRRRFGIS